MLYKKYYDEFSLENKRFLEIDNNIAWMRSHQALEEDLLAVHGINIDRLFVSYAKNVLDSIEKSDVTREFEISFIIRKSFEKDIIQFTIELIAKESENGWYLYLTS